eukprot:TRINITY_DN32791_c0_g1_i1.p1 TRINITY_DN32791_c0_g1~~TRINITY_DN32791_c0_g1_i1.p1  ORF type:complete len:396 (-),score=42.09 TRINITY_DN32791_c0_g1_i1:55-1242(-)
MEVSWIACILALVCLGNLVVAYRYPSSVAALNGFKCFCRMLPETKCEETKRRDSNQVAEARFFHPQEGQTDGLCCKIRKGSFGKTCKGVMKCYDKEEPLDMCTEDKRRLPSLGCCKIKGGAGVVIRQKRRSSVHVSHTDDVFQHKPHYHVRKEDVETGMMLGKDIDPDTAWSYLSTLLRQRGEADHITCTGGVSESAVKEGKCVLRESLSECCCPVTSPVCHAAQIDGKQSWAEHESIVSGSEYPPNNPEFRQPLMFTGDEGISWRAAAATYQWDRPEPVRWENVAVNKTIKVPVEKEVKELSHVDPIYHFEVHTTKKVVDYEEKTETVMEKKCVQWRHTKRCGKGKALYEPIGSLLQEEQLLVDKKNPLVMNCPRNMVKSSDSTLKYKCECPRA